LQFRPSRHSYAVIPFKLATGHPLHGSYPKYKGVYVQLENHTNVASILYDTKIAYYEKAGHHDDKVELSVTMCFLLFHVPKKP
jgi:hypothetical protein